MLTGCHAAPPTYDIIIRQGTIYDGTGGAGMIGDVALRDGRIAFVGAHARGRSEEHTSELQSLMRISYAVFCLKKKKKHRSYNNVTLYTNERVIIMSIQV